MIYLMVLLTYSTGETGFAYDLGCGFRFLHLKVVQLMGQHNTQKSF